MGIKDSKEKKAESMYEISSRMIHGEMESDVWDYSHHIVPPITSSSAYRLENVERGAEGFVEYGEHPLGKKGHAPVYIYDRLGEPSGMMLQRRLADLEGADIAVIFGSGMAAISAAILFDLKAGDHVLADSTLYGCTYSLMTNWLPKYNIHVSLVDFANPDEIIKAFRPNTRVLYFETPTNPKLTIHDISAINRISKELSKKYRQPEPCRVIVDNTFATPFFQRPLALGADLVVESLTKHVNGFGTDTGGVVAGPRSIEQKLMLWRKDFGGILSPKSAWNHLVYGIPTLELRTRREQDTAMKVASFLESHPKLWGTVYPGLRSHPEYEIARSQMKNMKGEFCPGSMIYFKVRGTSPEDRQKRAIHLMNTLAKESYCITLAVSLGQVRTLIEHPSSMTHSAIPPEEQVKIGINPSGIRLSIGLEAADDIIRDLDSALNKLPD